MRAKALEILKSRYQSHIYLGIKFLGGYLIFYLNNLSWLSLYSRRDFRRKKRKVRHRLKFKRRAYVIDFDEWWYFPIIWVQRQWNLLARVVFNLALPGHNEKANRDRQIKQGTNHQSRYIHNIGAKAGKCTFLSFSFVLVSHWLKVWRLFTWSVERKNWVWS